MFLILNSFNVWAQSVSPQVINSAGGGGAVGSTGIEIYYSIGEPFITTLNGSNTIITQGFLQPYIAGEFGLVASAFVTPASCADKTDGTIKIEASVSGAVNQANFQLSYYWSSVALCNSASTCSLVTDLPAGTYSVMVVSHYIPTGANIRNDTVRIANVIIAGSTEPCQISVYNGVTPNGDNINDYFHISNIEQFENNHVEIFNRWGQKLAEIKHYDNTHNFWRGTIGNTNEIAPSGTYFYVIELGNGTAPIKGWLELTGQR